MLIFCDLRLVGCLSHGRPSSVSVSWHFLQRRGRQRCAHRQGPRASAGKGPHRADKAPRLVAGTRVPSGPPGHPDSARTAGARAQLKRIAIAPMMLGAALLAACAGAGSTFAHGGTAQPTPGTAAATTSPPARSPIEGTWRSGKLTKAEFLRAYDATGGGAVGSRFETGPSF